MVETEQYHTVRGYQLLEQNKRKLTSAMEDYLEMIYRNSLAEGYMRISHLSQLLNVQASSATKMVQKLTSLGLLNYKKYGIIFLTENGQEIGKFLLERHIIIEKFLKMINIEVDVLHETELIEHDISISTLNKISLLSKFFETYPEIHNKFRHFKTIVK